MRSLSSSLVAASLSCGYFFSTVLVSVVNKVTEIGQQRAGWLSGNNLNLNKLDYFYWLSCRLSVLNFLNYLFWAHWYKYKEEVEDGN
eukprot:c50857_g1_i1 orf=59-319(-)